MSTPTKSKEELYFAAESRIRIILQTLVNENKISIATHNSISEQIMGMGKSILALNDIVKTVWDKGYDYVHSTMATANSPAKGKAFDLEAHTIIVLPHNKNANRD